MHHRAFRTSSITVTSGGERNLIGGPHVPEPRLTWRIAPFARSNLPVFKGYVLDERLREFRKVTWKSGEPSIEYIPFLSEKGALLLKEIIRKAAHEGLNS